MSTINLNVDTGQGSSQYQQQPLRQNPAAAAPSPALDQGYGHAYPTPVSAQSFHQSMPGSGEAGPSRRNKNSVMQMEIDGMEHQARELRLDDAGDGRLGVEDPCKSLEYHPFERLC